MKVVQKVETDLGSRIEIAFVIFIFIVLATHRNFVLFAFSLLLFLLIVWYWWSFKNRIILKEETVEIHIIKPFRNEVYTLGYSEIKGVGFIKEGNRGDRVLQMFFINKTGQEEVISIAMRHHFPRYFMKELKEKGVEIKIVPEGNEEF